MKLVIAVLSLFVCSAEAHVTTGIYAGRTTNGEACELNITAVTFEGGVRHPLNERIEATAGRHTFVLRHPPVISVQPSSASFDHDSFHGIKAMTGGGEALVVKMAHTATYEGPTEFHHIRHAYQAGTATTFTCSGLQPR